MEKKNLDWANLGFGYVKTDKRFVANYKDGAWDDGVITDDDKVVLNECAGVLQYAQTCFEGLRLIQQKTVILLCSVRTSMHRECMIPAKDWKCRHSL